jgi:aryl-alcohol dehydrogenase-like predicted oxidoreductase/predicted kinase
MSAGADPTIGLGCMRLSTAAERDDDRAVEVIRAALDAGATLLDTADAYCHDESDVGHNERLVARALPGWAGDRSAITVATKGGIRRPQGAWVNDGRAKHLRDACDASRRALGVDAIDLYQLHAVDPKTPLETSVRALAALQREGAIRRIGLCNVTVGQIEAARTIAEIASVQVSLSVADDENLRNGVAEYCRENGIRLIAHRPLGGVERAKRLGRDPVLASICAKHRATAHEIALAWLTSFGADVVPVPGATRVETAESIARVLSIRLDDDDRRDLDARYAGRLLRVPRRERRPPADAEGEVVIVMGMPGAGKSTIATAMEVDGYDRLNRDALGGGLADLVPRLEASLASGRRRFVLDNTYPSRRSRNEVIECAWAHGVPVRCVWLATDIGNAQINAIMRMLDAHGRLPTPEDIRERGKRDPRYLGPDAQFRYERTVEAPVVDEGFTTVDVRTFTRTQSQGAPALILDFDDVFDLSTEEVTTAPGRHDVLARYRAEGWLLFAHAWRPDVARGRLAQSAVEASFAQARERLAVEIDLACCPHDAGPPICWCRKPIPGSVLEFAVRRGVSLTRSLVIGRSASDRTMAERLGAECRGSESFW